MSWRLSVAFLSVLTISCGGGGGSSSSMATTSPSTAANSVAMIVDGGPAGLRFINPNVGFVTVTVCAPGTNNCQTIDHIAVDTGSSGLRIAGGVLSASLAAALTPQQATGGAPIAECLQFADGSLFWGWVRNADVKMAGESAPSSPIQVLGDATLPVLPAGCTGTLEARPSDIGANGILGVGTFLQDCGAFCAGQPANGIYYACPTSTCRSVAVSLSQQVAHPVSLFAQDNNGVLIQLPAVMASGAVAPTGLLIFGIGTQADNALGVARVFSLDPVFGLLTMSNGGTAYVDSFLDSGSNVWWIPTGINNQVCPSTDPTTAGFLCPSPSLNLSISVTGQNNATTTVPASVVDARTLFTNPNLTAFNNLGAPNNDPNGIVFGLPFFLGRNVFTAIEDSVTPGGIGPYVAF